MKADIWGLIAPNCPQVAARYAEIDGKVAHQGVGVEGEIFIRRHRPLRTHGLPWRDIEIFVPAEGLYAYSGLDTTNHYSDVLIRRIDPELGTMDDFRRLVRVAHSKGLAVVIFPNIGYFSVEAPDWITARQDPESEQAK